MSFFLVDLLLNKCFGTLLNAQFNPLPVHFRLNKMMDRSRLLLFSDPLCSPSARFHCLIWVKWWGNGGRMRESERAGLFFWEQSVGEMFCLQLFAFVAWLMAGYSNVSLATSESLLSSWWSDDLVATSRSLSNTYSCTLSTYCGEWQIFTE